MEGDWDPPSALQFCARSQLKFPSSSSGEEVWPLQNPLSPIPPPPPAESFNSAVAVKARAAIVKAQVRFLLSIAQNLKLEGAKQIIQGDNSCLMLHFVDADMVSSSN